MKIQGLFFVLLYRPETCQVWTPYPCEDRDSGNFFTTGLQARAYARTKRREKQYLIGAEMWVRLEFKIGMVCVQHDPKVADITSPDLPALNPETGEESA